MNEKILQDFSKRVLVEFIRQNLSNGCKGWLRHMEQIDRQIRFDDLYAKAKEIQREISCFDDYPAMVVHKAILLDKSHAIGKKMDRVLEEMRTASEIDL